MKISLLICLFGCLIWHATGQDEDFDLLSSEETDDGTDDFEDLSEEDANSNMDSESSANLAGVMRPPSMNDGRTADSEDLSEDDTNFSMESESSVSLAGIMRPPSRHFERCLRQCSSTSEYSPVCGTDSMTYENAGELLCARKCGRHVRQKNSGVCNNNNNVPRPTTLVPRPTSLVPRPTSLFPTSSTGSNRPGTHDPVCFRQCPKTSEYNPLCGTNGMTYDNESRLRCAQQCGANVQKRSDGTCGPPPLSPRPTSIVVPMPPNFRSCIRQCIISAEYRPICATGNINYNNESQMECERSCGLNISKLKDGRC